MIAFLAFYRKEWMESLRRYRALILFIVCTIFGIGSPLLAKLLPNLLSGYKINGLAVKIPKPTTIDAFSQFYKNFAQMGMIVLLLTFAGLLAQELTKGTLIIPLSKGLPRITIILAKYAHALSLWTLCYVTAAVVQCIYTQYLFFKLPARHLLFSLFCLWLFGAFLLALLLFSSVWVKGSFGGLAMTGGCVAFLFIGQTVGRWRNGNPLSLVSEPVRIISGQTTINQMSSAIWWALIVIFFALSGSIFLFVHKQLPEQ
ncbi:MAG: ABC transporter permease subunit [Sporolactobacillus sp.]